MLIGYNNDVQHRGKTFHIQTEDRGMTHQCIETQIFHAGAILDTRIISYEDIVAEEADEYALKRKIKSRMQKTHRELYRNLMTGAYDQYAGLEPLEGAGADASVAAEDFTPSQERVPDSARVLEEGGDPGLPDDQHGHVNLSALKAKLARLGPDVSEATEAPAKPEDTASRLPSLLSSTHRPRVPSRGGLRPVTAGVDYTPTGTRAWLGCKPPQEDPEILDLVQSFLESL